MKCICTIFLLISFQFLFAQTYHPFPGTGANWSEYSYTYSGGGGFYESYYGWLYALGNDTMINSLKYATVGYNNTWAYFFTNGSTTSFTDNTVVVPGKIFGAIREDSAKKVWFRNFYSGFTPLQTNLPSINTPRSYNIILPADTEILLYDFNLQLGDSIKWGSYNRTVISIDSIMFQDGSTKRRYLFNYLTNSDSDYIVEGMGSSLGLFGMYNRYSPFLAGGCWLNCFSQGNQNLIQEATPTSYVNCDLNSIAPAGINSISTTDGISLFPNPSQNKVNIDFDNTTHHIIQITNPLGQALFKTDSYNKNYEMDISFLANGIYFISVTNDEKKTFVKKLIKI